MILSDAQVVLNSVDISSAIKEVHLQVGRETPDDTVMGLDARIAAAGGLEVVQLSLVAKQAFTTAAPALDATLWGIHAGKAAVAITIRPVDAARSSSNPEWGLNVVLANYHPLDGSVGDNLQTPIELRPASAISRATSST